MCAILKDAKLRLKLIRQELQFPVRKIITVKAGIQTENNKKLSDSTVSFSLTHLDTEQREYLSGESPLTKLLFVRFLSVFARHLQSVYSLSRYCKHDAGWTERI